MERAVKREICCHASVELCDNSLLWLTKRNVLLTLLEGDGTEINCSVFVDACV